MSSSDWTAHVAPGGQPYFYNANTGESSWAPPYELKRSASFGSRKKDKAAPVQPIDEDAQLEAAIAARAAAAVSKQHHAWCAI